MASISGIRLAEPFAPTNYNYSLNTNEIRDVLVTGRAPSTGDLGGRINLDYESGTKWTPIEKAKFIAFTVAAVSTIVAVGLVIAGVSAAISPLLFVAIPFAVVAVGALIYGLTRGEDFDSPKKRAEIMTHIKDSSFQNIAKSYADKNIIGYRLLDTAYNCSDMSGKHRFYQAFICLRGESDHLNSWKNRALNHAENQWAAHTLPFRNWYTAQKAMIQQRRENMHLREDLAAEQIHRVEHCRQRPAVGLRIANGMMQGVHFANRIELASWESNVEREYGMIMGPWNTWKNTEIGSINATHMRISRLIENEFSNIKTVAMQGE